MTAAASTGPAGPAAGAAFFDLDRTLIATSSTLAFGRSFRAAGLISRGAVLRGGWARLVYALGRVDENRMARLRDGLARTVSGWEASRVSAVVEAALHELIDPLVYAEALELIADHRRAGRAVVLISTSGEEVVRPIGELLEVDHVVGTRLAVTDGRYTGEVEFYAFGPFKAQAMRELAAEHGWSLADSYAYSDSATDLPMLVTVGHPSAVNPDRRLRQEALARNWPVLDFRHPVALRRRLAHTARPAAVVGVVLTAGALGMRHGRRVHRLRTG